MTLEQFIGIAIRDARRARDWTQADLAQRIRVHSQTIHRLENATVRTRRQSAYWAHLKAVSAALHITPGALISIAEVMHARALPAKVNL